MITYTKEPQNYTRLYDTNRNMYIIDSSNAHLTNFRFYIDVYVEGSKVATVRKRPLTDGTCYFNPSEIISNYITYNLEVNISGITAADESDIHFYLNTSEEYGTTPLVYTGSTVQSTELVGYNGLAEYIAYDLYGGNNQWVINSGSTGRYLTDALFFRVAPTDYGNLYFITDFQPECVRYKIYHYDTYNDYLDNSSNMDTMDAYLKNPSSFYKGTNPSQSAPYIEPSHLPPGHNPPYIPPTPQFDDNINYYYTGFTITYTGNNHMWYIPSGPKELEAMGMFDEIIQVSGGTWISYEIDITSDLTSGATVYNIQPMIYYRVNKCGKYQPIQLFWMNPHGGFDTYTFNKKNYMTYKVEKTYWNKRFSDDYVLGERGVTTFNTDSIKNIILNTDYLNDVESQLLVQLVQSPEVYAVFEYNDEIYKIPYIVVTNNIEYKQIKNEKMVQQEIVIQPAWSRVSQKS